MERAKILITIKTYPTISTKYIELACTAGVKEDGSLIRLYPIPFRLLQHNNQYRKYQWIEIDIKKRQADPRPESYCPTDIDNIKPCKIIGTDNGWEERRKRILEKNKIYYNKAEIIKLAHANKISLAIFKPTKIIDLVVEEAEAEWSKDKLEAALKNFEQQDFLLNEKYEADFKIMPKLPYKFSYVFTDDEGKKSTLMIEDWEIGQLYWSCWKQYGGNEKIAIEKVRQKYFHDFACKKDIYLFLGTTLEWHRRKAPNPYVIVGVFYPPYPYPQQPRLL